MHKLFSFFWNPYFNQHLGSMFRMCSFDSKTFQSDILDLDIKFRYFSKKLEIRFLQHISSLAEKIPFFLPRSSNMVKLLLEICWVDPGDAFTYLLWSHIMSTSNFWIREKKFQISFFMHISFRETSKRSLRSYFQRVSNFFFIEFYNFFYNAKPCRLAF